MSNLDESVPNDGFRKVKKMSRAERERELRRRFGDALKPLPPSRKPGKGKGPKSEKKAPAPTWPVRSTGDDFWHRDAMTTLRRFHAEEKVRAYAKALGWGEIRMQHLPELLEREPEAVYSVTWRDLFASAVRWVTRVLPSNPRASIPLKVGEDGIARVAGPRREVELKDSEITFYTASPKKLPQSIEEFGKPLPQQTEALEALRLVAAFLTSPPLDGKPSEWLDLIAKDEDARRGKRQLGKVRKEIADKGHTSVEALKHARRRERGKRKR